MIAVQENLLSMADRLLQLTPNKNHTLVLKSFSMAVCMKRNEIVDLFLQYPFDLNNTIYKDKTPLLHAIETSLQLASTLLTRRDVDVNKGHAANGKSPLLVAVE